MKIKLECKDIKKIQIINNFQTKLVEKNIYFCFDKINQNKFVYNSFYCIFALCKNKIFEVDLLLTFKF